MEKRVLKRRGTLFKNKALCVSKELISKDISIYMRLNVVRARKVDVIEAAVAVYWMDGIAWRGIRRVISLRVIHSNTGPVDAVFKGLAFERLEW